jgi:hypothetical protein
VELIGIYLVACGLLVVAGVAKAARPDDTARALAAVAPLGQRTLRMTVRVGSAAEAILGVTALVLPHPWWAGLVALSYAGFAGFVAYARSTGGAVASCGCFGTPDTPATLVHAVINGVLALSALFVAVAAPTGTLSTVLRAQPAHGIPLVVVSALAGWLVYLAISVLARVQAARALTGVTFDRHRPAS